MTTREAAGRIARGDWQTPLALAEAVVARLAGSHPAPRTILEPTCGEGAFLVAAGAAFPTARLLGLEIDPGYAKTASRRVPEAEILQADFFRTDFRELLSRVDEPVLVVGNPPWVTTATLGALAARNLPEDRTSNLKGLDAVTGKSNFDVSEWMIAHLLERLVDRLGRGFLFAMLCKASVARRLLLRCERERWPVSGEVIRIDARGHFEAAVDAVVLVLAPGEPGSPWPVYPSLEATVASSSMGVVDDQLTNDVDALLSTRDLEGPSALTWRSGLKHDCAAVLELASRLGRLENGRGERVDVEGDRVFPLLKGSDVFHGRPAERRVILPQDHPGQDPAVQLEASPRLARYLAARRAEFDARKSRIYRGRPPYSIFGVGPYSFAPFKVAVAGLYKELRFVVVPPLEGRPVMFDDTVYFLPCDTEAQARRLRELLGSERVRRFFEARLFWDAKRPIQKSVLSRLSLDGLTAHGRSEAARSSAPRRL
jgi:hypothetical protein